MFRFGIKVVGLAGLVIGVLGLITMGVNELSAHLGVNLAYVLFRMGSALFVVAAGLTAIFGSGE